MADGTFLTALGTEAYEGFGRIEDTNPSQTTVLLQKKREIQAVQRQINQKRDECEQRIIACKGRESLLEEKQFKIQEAIKRFDKFIQENDVKRSRAAKKERDERLERVAKEAEAEEHKTKLKGLQAARLKQKRELEMGRIYERYLETVVESSGGDFDEIEDALKRFATLQGTMDDLAKSAEEINSKLEEIKTSTIVDTKETQDNLLVATSSIAKKQKDLENLRNTRMRLEQQLTTREDAANDNISTIGEARRAIANIYLRCRKPNHPVLNHEEEMMKVLEYIKFRCGDLGNVAARKSEAPEKKPDPPPKKRPTASEQQTGDRQAAAKSLQSRSSTMNASKPETLQLTTANLMTTELPEIAEIPE